MTNATNATPVTDRVFAAMRADVMYCPTVEDMAAVIRERGSVLPDAGAVWAVWHREDDGSLVLCEFDGCVCYTAHRTREAAVKAAAETNDCYQCEKYVAAIVPAGIACCLGDDIADTMRAGGGDFEWSAFMEGGFICLRVPAPNMSIAPAPASATPLSCHLIPTPSGRFAFAGRVPTDLAFAASNPDYVATALQCGPGIAQKQAAREGGTFRSLSWATEADAYAYAAGLGYAVPGSATPAPAMVPQPVQQQQAQDMRDCGQVPSAVTVNDDLPEGYSLWQDQDGDWWLQPPADVVLFSVPGEARLIGTCTRAEAVADAHTELATLNA